MSELFDLIDEFQAIYGVCPCCGEIFHLSDAKFRFPSKEIKDDPFLKLKQYENKVMKTEQRNEASEIRFDELMAREQEKARRKGQLLAKRELKKIDPLFSGKGKNPQDVKTIFDPVDFIVFDGMNSESEKIKNIDFVAYEPHNSRQEKILKSIQSTIRKGDLEFKSLRVGREGEIEIEE